MPIYRALKTRISRLLFGRTDVKMKVEDRNKPNGTASVKGRKSAKAMKRNPKTTFIQPSFNWLLILTISVATFLISGNIDIGVSALVSNGEPIFVSRSETYKIIAGDTIALPCEVANTGDYIVAWKRGIAILTAGDIIVSPDPRVRLANGYTLQIHNAVPQDGGDYVCQIATLKPREMTHTVQILVPPRIHHVTARGHLQVRKGSSVRIECLASGNPAPNITWIRRRFPRPGAKRASLLEQPIEEVINTHLLSIDNIERSKSGTYVCTADNGVGVPATSFVVVHVLFPPIIAVEKPIVYASEGEELSLICVVTGETQPELLYDDPDMPVSTIDETGVHRVGQANLIALKIKLVWYKDTMQLDTTERHIMEKHGTRHILIIRSVHPQDFGNYSCVAENQLGKTRRTIILSGKPKEAIFTSPPISQFKDRYNISWSVNSFAPIEEFRLSYRRVPPGEEIPVDNSLEVARQVPPPPSVQPRGYEKYGSERGNGHAHRVPSGFGFHWSQENWRSIVVPSKVNKKDNDYFTSYMILGLDPDLHYEASVLSRSRYGWSTHAKRFFFSTSSNDSTMRDLSVKSYGGAAGRKYHTLVIHSIIALNVFLAFHY